MRSLLATIDEKQSTRPISLQPNIVMEKSAHMSSQYLCGTSRPHTSHVVHEIKVLDAEGRMQYIRALIDCGASSIFISQKLVRSLGLETSAAYTTTRGLDGRILAHARNSQKLNLTMQYLPQLTPVEELDVLVVDMKAYDIVLGIPWFEIHNPDIDWVRKRLISLRNPVHAGTQNPVNSGTQS